MRWRLIFCLVGLITLSTSVYSQNKTFTLSLKDKTVKEILDEIENRSEFRFFYNDKFVDINRKTSVVAENKSITDILTQLFLNTTITYQLLENNLSMFFSATAQL